MKNEIINGVLAEMGGAEKSESMFFCPTCLSAILPLGLKPESFHLAAAATAGQTQSNRCSWSSGRENPCKCFTMNYLQLNPSQISQSGSKWVKPVFEEGDRMENPALSLTTK
jgi:hypothetical protein